MTKIVQHICKDCGEIYHFQASGMFAPENNDPDWCPTCAALINAVRKTIKRKFDWRWEKSNDYTLLELQSIESNNERIEKEKHDELCKSGRFMFPRVRKCIPCLFDMKDGENKNIANHVVTPSGTYCYSYWTKKGETKISKRIYWDLINNKISEIQPNER